MAILKSLTIRGKKIMLPIYLPDATRAVVRSLDTNDLALCQIEAIVVNTFHLMINPGVEILHQAGGVGKFMNFSGLVVSDSGGFQIMSLVHQRKIKAKITEAGIEFVWRIAGADKKILFTPEASIQTQFAINSDLMVVLDYFTDPKASVKEQKRSVELTLLWAKRSKQEFQQQIKKRQLTAKTRPWLMGVVQGGTDLKLRKACAQALVDLDFDVYGYGGWPMDEQGKFDKQLFSDNAKLTPNNKPRFALGVGKPEDIVLGTGFGYGFFDCVLPTRDARHGRLYIKMAQGKALTININQGKYAKDLQPVSQKCNCLTCQNYTRAYLHHLFKIKDSLAWRLATLHNLFFYNQVVASLRLDNKLTKL